MKNTPCAREAYEIWHCYAICVETWSYVWKSMQIYLCSCRLHLRTWVCLYLWTCVIMCVLAYVSNYECSMRVCVCVCMYTFRPIIYAFLDTTEGVSTSTITNEIPMWIQSGAFCFQLWPFRHPVKWMPKAPHIHQAVENLWRKATVTWKLCKRRSYSISWLTVINNFPNVSLQDIERHTPTTTNSDEPSWTIFVTTFHDYCWSTQQ